MPARRRRAESGLVLALYVGVVIALFERTWRHPASSIPGEGGDPIQTIWALRWFPFALAHGFDPLVTTTLGHPDGINLMANTTMPLVSFLVMPVTVLAGPIVAYNVIVTLALALSGWAAYLALRRHVRGRPGPIVGGLVYGVSPYMASQALGHPNLVIAVTPPLALMLLEDLVLRTDRRVSRIGICLGLLAVAQFLIFEELLATEAIAALAFLGTLAVLHPRTARQRAPRALAGIGVGLLVFAVGAAVPIVIQFAGPAHLPGAATSMSNVSSDALGFVVPSDHVERIAPPALAAISADFFPNPLEHGEYLGALLIVALGAVLVRHRRATLVRIAVVVGLACAILSLGPDLHVRGRLTGITLPGYVIGGLPVVGQLIPSRIIVYTWFAVAAIVAVGLDGIRRDRRRVRAWCLGLLLTAGLVAVIPLAPYPSTSTPTPGFFASDAVTAIPVDSVALVAPFPSPFDVDGMLWQAQAGMRFRMPGGYFYVAAPGGGVTNQAQGRSVTAVTMHSILAGDVVEPGVVRFGMRADMRSWRVDSVVVGPMPHHDEMVALLEVVLGRTPRSVGGVELWTGVGAELGR